MPVIEFETFNHFAVPVSLFLGIGILLDKVVGSPQVELERRRIPELFPVLEAVYNIVFRRLFGANFFSAEYLFRSFIFSIIAFTAISLFLIGRYVDDPKELFSWFQSFLFIYCAIANFLFDSVLIKMLGFFLGWAIEQKDRLRFVLVSFLGLFGTVQLFAIAAPLLLLPLIISLNAVYNFSISGESFVKVYEIDKYTDDGLSRFEISVKSNVERSRIGGSSSFIYFETEDDLVFFDAISPIDHYINDRTPVKISLFTDRSAAEVVLLTESGGGPIADSEWMKMRELVSEEIGQVDEGSFIIRVDGELRPLSVFRVHDILLGAIRQTSYVTSNITRLFYPHFGFRVVGDFFALPGYNPYLYDRICYDGHYIVETKNLGDRICRTTAVQALGRSNNVYSEQYPFSRISSGVIPLSVMLLTSLLLASLLLIATATRAFAKVLFVFLKNFSLVALKYFSRAPFSISGCLLGCFFGLSFVIR
ncbi:hypothetical protein [Rhodovulum euryhalinum]|uniref:Uncharacterized protein n=1 Tax=Rhodovulum euryhalinum TaxID=35805 RepID=A0A4R2KK96_9RHOB|nr:hypothetical protein [Rhodovulum euryhalinum]TCO72877.1 hypothetical protein EV655_103106 [Rhodovulum euryhalinum]